MRLENARNSANALLPVHHPVGEARVDHCHHETAVQRVGVIARDVDAPEEPRAGVGGRDEHHLVRHEGRPLIALDLGGRFFFGEHEVRILRAEAKAVGCEARRHEEVVSRAAVDLQGVEDGSKIWAGRMPLAEFVGLDGRAGDVRVGRKLFLRKAERLPLLSQCA